MAKQGWDLYRLMVTLFISKPGSLGKVIGKKSILRQRVMAANMAGMGVEREGVARLVRRH